MPKKILQQLLERSPNANKYDFGHVLVLGGSPGMVGAPFLAAEAALRAGAGLVTIASHAGVIDKLEKRVKEVMTVRISSGVAMATDEIIKFVEQRKVSVIIIGPGQTPDFSVLALTLLSKLSIPVILDAGAVTAWHDKLDLLKKTAQNNPNIILTPHAGEYQKLTGKKAPEDREELKQTVSRFAQDYQVTLVFKGHHTLVAHPDGRVYENSTGNPGLATAGSGDVLSGIIGGIAAQVSDRAAATDAAIYLHGLAGDLAAKAKTQPGMIASDVIDQIPAALLL
jgi:hydroxyethylthiazole kinase-like uncharacterized protein yjeF